MARPKKRYHYIYKTTCNVTGKYYIGMHSTSNLEDGYMGSGKRLRYSIRKHGVENHTREIIEFLDDRDSLAKREAEIVNEELINDPLCMNLKCGGNGGFISNEQQRNRSILGGRSFSNKMKTDIVFRTSIIENLKKFTGLKSSFFGKFHSDESKRLIGEKNSIKQKGSGNSQFGTCWITNEVENKKIKKGDLIPEGWRLGRRL